MTGSHSTSGWGVTGFLVQRISSLVLAAYALCLAGYFLVNSEIDSGQLQAFFGHLFMRALSLVALVSFVAHAWVGLWTVGTDYIRPHYFGRFSTIARAIYNSGVVALLFGQAVWWLVIIIRL